jgi:septum formation topological specificity factor MinE
LLELYELGRAARYRGETSESFEDIRQELLELVAKLGETVLHEITVKLAKIIF